VATFDQPSDVLNRIAYPNFRRPGLRTDSRVASFPARAEKPLLVPSGQQGIQASLFREIELGATFRRNPWAAVGSLAFQFAVLLTLVIVPLYHVATLPKSEMLTRLYFQPPAAAGSSASSLRAPTSKFMPATIRIPSHKTQETAPTPPSAPAAPMGGVVGGIPGGVVGGAPIGGLSEVVGGTRNVSIPVKPPDPAPIKRVYVPARIAEANLVHDVAPTYPPEAGRSRIEGTVVLVAVIGKDGSVQDVRVESGLPILAQAAIDAVKQWRYRPYLLNGEPVEVDSRITVNFTLSKG